MKKVFILAGANGSGKSTIAKVLLPTVGIAYVNPDDIARELNPSDLTSVKIAAGREALRRIDEMMARGGRMPEIVEKMTQIGCAAVKAAQEENRRKGIANVYVLNGKLVWQLPDGSITTKPQ